MTERLATERDLEGILRRLGALEQWRDRNKVEVPLYATSTYTPTYFGGTTPGTTTYSVGGQVGGYARIGNLVTAWGTLVWINATGTGNARISLPFTASASANNNVAAYVRTVAVTFANGSVQAQVAAGTNYIEMLSPATNAASTTLAVEAAGNIIFTVAYPID